MRFHEPLIAMRRRGRKPAAVFLIVDCPDADAPGWAERDPGFAHVAIEPWDSPSLLDLRFLVGCEVHVLGQDEARLQAVFKAAGAAGAALVLSVFDGEFQIHSREVSHG